MLLALRTDRAEESKWLPDAREDNKEDAPLSHQQGM